MGRGPLEGITVLDLGQLISGPYCAKLLGDYGAEVIKVETPPEGDPARKVGPFPDDVPHAEKSGLFLHLNLNKKGITLNLNCTDGAKILKELVRQADVLVENFPPSYLPSLGLDYGDLEPVNPRLVMTSITPFGRTGPYRDYKATEMGVFAMSGRMQMHGHLDREPLRYGPDISWFQAGATAVVATLGAILVSRTQGVGQQVDVSAMEALIGNVDSRLLNYVYSGAKTTRGYQLGGYPQGAFPCKNGYVLFASGFDRFFQRLCHAMGRGDLLEDPSFANPEARSQNLEELDAIFLGWTLNHTKQEIFQTCQASRVPCAPLLGPDELLEDPQLKARGFFVEADHSVAGRLSYPGPPFKMAPDPQEDPDPAPLIGEHNAEVYCDRLGYSRQKMVNLQSKGVI